jgi:hypothetical protein
MRTVSAFSFVGLLALSTLGIGKVVKIDRWSVDPDGRTMHVRFDNTKGFVQEQTGHKVE